MRVNQFKILNTHFTINTKKNTTNIKIIQEMELTIKKVIKMHLSNILSVNPKKSSGFNILSGLNKENVD